MKKNRTMVLVVSIVLTGLMVAGCTDNGPANSTTNVTFPPPPAIVKEVSIVEALSNPYAYDTVKITGSVNQSIDVSGYTYLEVTDGTGSLWVAGYTTSLENGTEVTASGSLMKNFPSSSLGRTFEVLLLADSVSDGTTTTTSGSPHGSDTNNAVTDDINVTPVEGSTSIADIIANSATLSGQEVTVTAVVVKSTPLINEVFLTLDDNSLDENTERLKARCPNTFAVAIGDTVVITATVLTDVDLGSGYFYPVLLQVTDVE
ncbi:MAG: hypothetical protein P1P80_09220 [ANME-2 cluster archaeon]|nr:hypothetical protein [ANME-2 cluster archaeon]